MLRTRPATTPSTALPAVLAAATPARLSLGRAGLGVSMIARPRLLPSLLGADSATTARTAWVVQMLGAREVGLGLGAFAGLRAGDPAESRRWLLAGLVSDAVDAVAVAAAIGRGRVAKGPAAALVLVAAVATAVQAAELARRD